MSLVFVVMELVTIASLNVTLAVVVTELKVELSKGISEVTVGGLTSVDREQAVMNPLVV